MSLRRSDLVWGGDMVALTLQEMTPSISEHFISWLLRKGFTATVWIVAEGLTGLELHDDREAKHRGAAIRPSGLHRTLAAEPRLHGAAFPDDA